MAGMGWISILVVEVSRPNFARCDLKPCLLECCIGEMSQVGLFSGFFNQPQGHVA